MEKKQNNLVAKAMEKVARNTLKVSVKSRCMYILHQPKQPNDIKNVVSKLG